MLSCLLELLYRFEKCLRLSKKCFTSKESRQMLLIHLSGRHHITRRHRNAITTILLRLRSKDTTLRFDPFRSASSLSASFPNPPRISIRERAQDVARNWKMALLWHGACLDSGRNQKITGSHKPELHCDSNFFPRRYGREVSDNR